MDRLVCLTLLNEYVVLRILIKHYFDFFNEVRMVDIVLIYTTLIKDVNKE